MPYNPCGAAVDIVRRTYRTRCRPWKDSAEEVEIVWYPCTDTSGDLPYPSAIYSLDWDRPTPQLEGVGEVFDGPRPFKYTLAIPYADGAHQCGTESDFAGELEYDPDIDPVLYDEMGLPLCCGGPASGLFNLAVSFAAPLDPPGPVDVTLGTTCSDAPVLLHGVRYRTTLTSAGAASGTMLYDVGASEVGHITVHSWVRSFAGDVQVNGVGVTTGCTVQGDGFLSGLITTALPPPRCFGYTMNGAGIRELLSFTIFWVGTLEVEWTVDTGTC